MVVWSPAILVTFNIVLTDLWATKLSAERELDLELENVCTMQRVGFEFKRWKCNIFWTGDGAVVTDAQVRYTDLSECLLIDCIILVGDSVSLVGPGSVTVESQEELTQNAIKKPNRSMLALGLICIPEIVCHLHKS